MSRDADKRFLDPGKIDPRNRVVASRRKPLHRAIDQGPARVELVLRAVPPADIPENVLL
jgi:hypothetical protein